MNKCNECGRHHVREEVRCPFCGKDRVLGKLAAKMTLVFTPMMLGACYGVPPPTGTQACQMRIPMDTTWMKTVTMKMPM